MNTELIFKNSKLQISKIVIGLLSNNVYLIQSLDEKCIVDPSCNADILIDNFGTNIDKMILTHYHFDHIGAAKDIKKVSNCKVYASYIDAPIIEQKKPIPTMHRKVEAVEVDNELYEGGAINVGGTTWTVINTPGHSPGSICLICKNTGDKDVLIAGDTLFHQSCGRTDFVDGDPNDMAKSLKKLSKLKDDTLVLPGHGSETTIGYEKNFMLGSPRIF